MRESSTYQAILREGKAEGKAEGIAEGIAVGKAEGKAEGARQLLLLLGREHLGPPAPEFEMRLEAMIDTEQIEKLSKRLLGASSWEELFDESRPKRAR